MEFTEDWKTINQDGVRLYQEGRYAEAEDALRRALGEAEKQGPRNISVAVVLNNLGNLCHSEGKLEEAEAHYQRALEIRRERYSPEHPIVAGHETGLGPSQGTGHPDLITHTGPRTIHTLTGRHLSEYSDRHGQIVVSLTHIATDHRTAIGHSQSL